MVFVNPALSHLYMATGDPGIIETYEAKTLARLETIQTERGAHTFGFDASRNKVYVFLPQTHQAAVYLDQARSYPMQSKDSVQEMLRLKR